MIRHRFTASTTSSADLVSSVMHLATGSAVKVLWAAGIATRVHDTIAEMTKQMRPVEPPGPGTGVEEWLQVIHHQLESLAGGDVSQGLLFLEG
jgi:hypothetical protein